MARFALRLVVALGVLGVMGSGSPAEAQIPSAAGVIDACVPIGGGTTRLVPANQSCHGYEIRVRWNVVGPTGPKGDNGDPGAPGAQGPDGLPGATGSQGEPGVAGPQGAPGPAASAGAIGGQLASCIPGASLDSYLVHVPGRAFSVITGADGAFQIDNVPPGDYTVSVSAAAVVSPIEEIEVNGGIVTLPVLQQRYVPVASFQVTVGDGLEILPEAVQVASCAPPPPPPPPCGTLTTFFQDADADGFGDFSSAVQACTQPAGFTRSGGDCNDSNSRVNPGAVELLNGIDDDCDAQVDEGVAQPLNPLAVNRTGSGGGTVNSSPSGILCGTTCIANFGAMTTVVLTAAADATSEFLGWSGACTGTSACAVTMDAGKSVSARFELAIRQLAVSVTGPGSGTVTSSPAGISCGVGSTCSANYTVVTSVMLTATPTDGGSFFSGWTGPCANFNGNTCLVAMNASRNIVAAFGRLQ